MARDEDDDWAKPSHAQSASCLGANLAPSELAPYSIAELENYIRTLQAEISRIEGAIEAKQKQRGSAESLFKL